MNAANGLWRTYGAAIGSAGNHEAHGGTHLHFPLDGPVIGPIDIDGEADAADVIRAYAANHDSFDLVMFREVTREWRFKLKSG